MNIVDKIFFDPISKSLKFITRSGQLLSSIADSEIELYTGAGHGSGGTNTRRFATVGTNRGAAMTLTQSSTNGDSILINVTGNYAISYHDRANNYFNGARFGVSKNASSLTTSIESLTPSQIVMMVFAGEAAANAQGATGTMARTLKLFKGDIIRATTDANPDNATTGLVRLAITQVSIG